MPNMSLYLTNTLSRLELAHKPCQTCVQMKPTLYKLIKGDSIGLENNDEQRPVS